MASNIPRSFAPAWVDATPHRGDPDPTGLVFTLAQGTHAASLPWVLRAQNSLTKAGAVGRFEEFDSSTGTKRLVILVDSQSAAKEVNRTMRKLLNDETAEKIVKTFHPQADVADFSFVVRLRDPAFRGLR